MAEQINDIIECYLKTGKVPREWKRADIMLVFENGNKKNHLIID